ncbi:terminase small subunit [Pectinatus frisingensis]|uniref:terminase small subunit n=1 Tax=Pectinatus frisingensis TaxID=865 RepID=UPI003D803DB7
MKHEDAYQDYCAGMKYKEIAEKYNIKSVSTVKSWATRYWKVATTNKEVATERKSCNHKKVIKKKLLDSVDNNNDLTEKQRLFCIFYATSNNATQSYLKAYQCNKTTAMVEGCNHLKNIKIKAEIKRLKEILRATLNIDVSDMIQYCLKVVGADIGEYVTFGRRKVPVMGAFGPIIDKKTKKPIMHEINYIDANESCKLDTSLLQEIKQGRDGISIKMADKKWAWDKLEKYFGWSGNKHDKEKQQLELDKLKAEISNLYAKDKVPDKPDISAYINALKAGVKGIWNDE